MICVYLQRDLCAGETSTLPGCNKGQKCDTRTPWSSNIVLANPNHQKSSAAKKDRETFEKEQHGDRPSENSKKNIIQHIPNHTTCMVIYETICQEQKVLPYDRMHETRSNEALPQFVDRASQVPLDRVRSSQEVTKNKGCPYFGIMKLPGCYKTKGAVRKGDIIITIIVVRKNNRSKRKKGAGTKNKLQHDS